MRRKPGGKMACKSRVAETEAASLLWLFFRLIFNTAEGDRLAKESFVIGVYLDNSTKLIGEFFNTAGNDRLTKDRSS